MKKIIIIAGVALLGTLALEASRTSGFSISAYNAMIPPEETGSVALSPFNFEVDCCVFAEACDPIKRADIAERLGVLTAFQGTYGPIIEGMDSSGKSSAVSHVSAKALCLPDVLLCFIEYRRRIMELCGASVCVSWPFKGAERWMLAKMDGEMEDFEIPISSKMNPNYYRYFDLVSEGVSIDGETPVASEVGEFTTIDGEKREMPFMRTRRQIDYCRNQYYCAYRIMLRGGDHLYVLTPAPGQTFAAMRGQIDGDRLRGILASVESVTEMDCGHAWADISIPEMDFVTQKDLVDGFKMAMVPQGNFDFIDKVLTQREAMQRVRFRLWCDRSQPAPEQAQKKSEAAHLNAEAWLKDIGRIQFNQPFMFIVYHPDVDVVSIAGQWTGK